MLFNIGKSTVVRWKKNNLNSTFKVMATEMSITASEHDLSIVIDYSMKMPAQCSTVVEKNKSYVKNYFKMKRE